MKEFIASLEIIIVLYNIALEESESFRSLHKMSNNETSLNLFVYDNSQRPQAVGTYGGIHIFYVHDPRNSGVSKAYNEGAAHARKQGKKWVLLLDQDTKLPQSLLKSYWKATERNPELKLFVPILLLDNDKIFSPCAYRFKRGFYLDSIKKGIHSLRKFSPVNSGMLIDLGAFFEVGGYNNRVKLDFSDFQFIERFRKRHPSFFVMGVKCLQNFSDDEISLTAQASRFRYFCEGARNIDKNGILDRLQYSAVVFFRAVKLCLRHSDTRFFSIYLNTFFTFKKGKRLSNL